MERQNKNRQETLFEIKSGALLLQHNMSSHLLGEALYAQMEYDRLVEQFYAGNQEWCSDEDYETAKRDFDAFIRLLDAAIERGRQEQGEGASDKS
jgi:hypothetical protein